MNKFQTLNFEPETLNIHIPHIDFSKVNRPVLFILTRPFYSKSGWVNDEEVKKRWQVADDFQYTSSIDEATVLFIPNPINTYSKQELNTLNTLCKTHNIKGYGYISGDFGKQYPEFSQLIYFRMGGFESQLSNKNRGFPVLVSDRYEKLFGTSEIEIREKKELPVVGFCGHASLSILKKIKEKAMFAKENLRRFLSHPLRKDYEPLFASGFERARLLKILEQSPKINSRFIYRKHYRAGASNQDERKQTSREYFENIKNSDYVLCVRGAGNFSVRLYETLMMGRIPVFVNTDCLLPFEDFIDWKKHVVWVEWKDRENIAEKVATFHANLSPQEFKQLQKANRKLWKETLSVNSMLGFIKNS